MALLACVYLLWLRDSDLFAVEQVTITGATTADAADIEATLAERAYGTTTLNVDAAELEAVVGAYPIVAGVTVDRDLPHGLGIEVVERRPVAAVVPPGGDAVAVAADGTVLPGVDLGRLKARVAVERPPVAGRVDAEETLTALRALAAAPPALADRAREVALDPGRGLVVELGGGLTIVLGDGSELASKWAAATAVLAEGDLAGVGYVDVTAPGRPVAGEDAPAPAPQASTTP